MDFNQSVWLLLRVLHLEGSVSGVAVLHSNYLSRGFLPLWYNRRSLFQEVDVDVLKSAQSIVAELVDDPEIGSYIELGPDVGIPTPARGASRIRLMVVGQDPTVGVRKRRREMKSVLDARTREGPLRTHLSRLCSDLGLVMEENAYVTNLVKGFFTVPPALVKGVNLISLSAPHWIPLLKEEVAELPGVSILTLGQPAFDALINPGVNPQVRDYWGYVPDWEKGSHGEFHVVEPEDNVLGRVLIPFPHINTARRHRFYLSRWKKYVAFAKEWI